MYLSRIFIKNYRSINELDLKIDAGKTIIVGRNNSGKSNIISAIDLVLGEASPDYKRSENVTDTDFYTKRLSNLENPTCEGATNELFIFCELTRPSGENLDYNALYDCFGFYVIDEYRRGPRKRFVLNKIGDEYQEIFNLTDDNNEKTYLNPKSRNQKIFENELGDKYHFAFAFRAARKGSGIIEKDIRVLYRENSNLGWIIGLRATIRNALLQSAVIPSFRDPQTQLRITSWSWYGKLIKYLTQGSTAIPKVEEALRSLQEAANEVFNKAQTEIATSALAVAFPGTSLHLEFSTNRNSDIYRGCVIYVDDGFRSLLTEKGAGIQSATIIGLFTYFTRNVNTTNSALLCIEEPEVYLHPHARRVLSNRLDAFLDGARNQVLISTHSVEFLRANDVNTTIVLVSKTTEKGSVAKCVSLNDFKHLLRDNNQNELFFADKAIICEGFDDEIIRLVAERIYPGKLDEKNVSVVAVSGKDNIIRIIKLLLKLNMDCYVLTDFDFFLRDKKPDRQQYGAKAHDSVEELPKDFFEKRFGVNARSVICKISKGRAAIKKDYEKLFYTAKQVSDFSDQGLNLDKFKNFLTDLRIGGLGILEGEIEHLFIDSGLASPSKKLDLDSVFKLKKRLSDGVSIDQLIDMTTIQQLLEVVLSD